MLERIGKTAYHLDLATSKQQALRGLHDVFTLTSFDTTKAADWIMKHCTSKWMVKNSMKSKLSGNIVSFMGKYSF